MGGKFGIGVLAIALFALAPANQPLAQNNPQDSQTPAPETPASQTPAPQTSAPLPPTDQAPAGQAPAGQTAAPPQAPANQPPAGQTPPSQAPSTPVPPGSGGVGSPSVTVLNTGTVQGILGKEVRSAADEDMGRIVDVIVDGEGRARAAIIDFGGFLGVGSRKIAVDWKALHFVPSASRPNGVVLELTRDQVKPAPEYKEGKPIVVLGPSGALEPFP
jgi:PRC-barrel domain